jgi:hypothetical protein
MSSYNMLTGGAWGGNSITLNTTIHATEADRPAIAKSVHRAIAEKEARQKAVEDRHAKSEPALHVRQLQKSLTELRKELGEMEKESRAAQAAFRQSVRDGKPDIKKQHWAAGKQSIVAELTKEVDSLTVEIETAKVTSADELARLCRGDAIETRDAACKERDAALERIARVIRQELPNLAHAHALFDESRIILADVSRGRIGAPEAIPEVLPVNDAYDGWDFDRLTRERRRIDRVTGPNDKDKMQQIALLDRKIAIERNRLNKQAPRPRTALDAGARPAHLPNMDPEALVQMATAEQSHQ